MSNQLQIEKENQTTFTHSIKIEETSKGIRIHVHVYGNDQQATIIDALSTYVKTLTMFKEKGHVMASMGGAQ